VPGHDELRARQRHRMRPVGMVCAHQVEGVLHAGLAQVAKILRLPA
jgi:hypothetical protein